jgi:hypothetical protein
LLHIINITNYHLTGTNNDEQIIDVGADGGNLLHPDKSCNNMVLLNRTVLMVNCKSSIKGGINKVFLSAGLLVDLGEIEKKNVRYFYKITGFTYENLLDGKMVLFGNYPGDVFRFFVKEDATQCNF